MPGSRLPAGSAGSGLNTSNLGTWALIATARDSDATDGTATAAYATKTVINSLVFEYAVIPEPATMGMFATMGVCLFWIRKGYAR